MKIYAEESKLEKYILSGDFYKAKILVKHLTIKKLDEILFKLTYHGKSIAPYGFIWFLINENENAEYHSIASVLLSNGINYLPNAYNLALFHARRAVNLSPKNIGHKQFLLFFYNLPERLISESEALKIAKDVLKKYPDDRIALDVIEKLKNTKK